MKKEFFRVPSAAEILGNDRIIEVSDDMVNSILSLYKDQSIIIKRGLVPESFESSRKFMKHGPEVKPKRQLSLTQMLKDPQRPLDLRNEAMSTISPKAYSGYSFKPFIGTDRKTRRVHLVECLEAAKLYAYCHSDIAFKPHIELKPYHDAKRVAIDGTEIMGLVPSRTLGQGNYEIRFYSVPIAENKRKWGLAYNISTSHNCKSKLFNIRYRFETDKESSKQFNFCAHEIAMYMAIIDHYHDKHNNLIPIEQSQFALPTEFTADFYKRLDTNVVIQPDEDKNPRRLNRADKEILLWGLVFAQGRDHGFDKAQLKTFFATRKLREYDWS